jgi:hypothetical protein
MYHSDEVQRRSNHVRICKQAAGISNVFTQEVKGIFSHLTTPLTLLTATSCVAYVNTLRET